jgi:RNA polymerase sigma-70 factor (ECF subfamily)
MRWGRALRLKVGAWDTSGAPRVDVTQGAERADLRAYEAFFERHHGDIFSYLWRLTGDEQTASDLTQETFLRAWQHFSKVNTYDRPGAWLFRVATNLAVSHQRRRATPAGAPAPLDDDGGPASSDPAWRLAERESVRTTLMALPVRQRAVLVLREVYGLSGEQIATTLSISEGAVKMLLSRARESFRARYLREEGQP